MTTAPEIYRASIDDIGLCLAQQPLYQLQRLPGADTNDTFLYDDSFLHSNVSRRTLRARGDAIELMPGVATGLAGSPGCSNPRWRSCGSMMCDA
ncbi:HNH nuclease [Mycolicibacterium fortuitum]|uniref:HNH nuclease n=1 Tax=Mycolicibacterium fortuitum TaxID=1766 RepID=A0A378UVI2_MYCFO|nr:HNH nuclease [Mycolicibacterium fortuitum]